MEEDGMNGPWVQVLDIDDYPALLIFGAYYDTWDAFSVARGIMDLVISTDVDTHGESHAA
jgi:hypothetical protein